jgi:hypothetical protein
MIALALVVDKKPVDTLLSKKSFPVTHRIPVLDGKNRVTGFELQTVDVPPTDETFRGC